MESQAQENKRDSLPPIAEQEIGEVVVTGTRNETDVRHLPMTISVVDRKQIEERLESSVLPLLTEQVPGLFITSRGVMGYGVSDGAAGAMNLRGIGGSTTTGVLVLIDGHPQYMGLMGHPIADAYQSMLAERVEVLRGPASVLYGSNAMGGVINIVTRKQTANGVHTHVQAGGGSYGTVVTEVANRVRYNRFNSIVTGSYNRTDGHREDMPFEQYGGYAKVGYEFTDNWRAWGDVNVTHYNASNPGPVTEPLFDNDSHITRGMTSWAVENHYKYTSGSVSFFYNWGNHEINDGHTADEPAQESLFRSRDQMLGVSVFQSATLFAGNRLTAGFDYQRFGGEYWYKVIATGEKEPGVKKHEEEYAGYVDFRQDVSRWLTVDAGARVSHHTQTGTEFIPQGGLAFHLPRQFEIKAMVSKGYRNPTIREMYMFPPQNPDLKPESLVNYELSMARRSPDGRLSYGMNVFYINGKNVIMTDRSIRKNVNSGKIENWGIEADVNWKVNKAWHLTANYSWLHMEHPVLAAPEHKLFAGVDFHQGRWTASTGVMYVDGLYTSVSPAEETEQFVLWNARGSFRLSQWIHVFVKGENLLAQRYEINAGFPMPKATFMGGVNIRF